MADTPRTSPASTVAELSAERLINIAHSEHREQPRFDAREAGLLR